VFGCLNIKSTILWLTGNRLYPSYHLATRFVPAILSGWMSAMNNNPGPAADEETPLILREVRKRPTPFPWFQFCIVIILQLAEPLSLHVIFPFAPQVCFFFEMTTVIFMLLAYSRYQNIPRERKSSRILCWNFGKCHYHTESCWYKRCHLAIFILLGRGSYNSTVE
jgi:hypothetical protein